MATNPDRINIKDLDKNIYQPFADRAKQLDIDTSIDPIITTYTIFGQHDELDVDGFPVLWDSEYTRQNGETYIVKAEELDEAFAKKTNNGKRNRYYIKQNSRGQFYNPNGLYAMSNGRHNKDIKSSGGLEWKFREVNLRVFELYLSFLKSKNESWLLNAERSVN